MAQYGAQGGKRVLAHGALLSCEYSSGRVHFIVWEDGAFHARLLTFCQHFRVTQEALSGLLSWLNSRVKNLFFNQILS